MSVELGYCYFGIVSGLCVFGGKGKAVLHRETGGRPVGLLVEKAV
jgi:hypothetical protein